MKRFWVVLALAASVAACGGHEACPPMALQLAVIVRVTAAGASGPVTGAFVSSNGAVQADRLGCNEEADASVCEVPGGAGTYDLTIGAPDFVSVRRSVAVTCEKPTDCGCASDETQTISVALAK